MNQLIIPYQKNVKKKFDSFFCDNEKNDQIIDIIKDIFDNKNNQIYIWADKSFGKSHLLYAACNYFDEKNKKCVYLPLTDNKKFKPDILDGFENYDLVCIDDIDLILGNIVNNNDYLMIKGSNATGLNIISKKMIKGLNVI